MTNKTTNISNKVIKEVSFNLHADMENELQHCLPFSHDKLALKMDYMLSINYSMINSGIQVLNSLVIENNDTKDWHQLIIQINGHYIKDRSCRLEILKTGQSVQVNSIKIEPDFKILSEITEAIFDS